MFVQFHSRKAQSTIEIASLVVFVLTAMLIFQKYIARGMYGKWKQVGDAFGQGRLYDPITSVACGYDQWQDTGLWFNQTCFDEDCGERDCVAETKDDANCVACISVTCRSSYLGRDVCNDP